MKKFTSTENCNALFAALSEFHRLLDRFNEGEGDCPSLNQILKKNNIDKNYYKFIKEVLNERKLVNIQFTKWSDKKSLPNFQMAQSIAEEASKRLSAYQRDLKKKRDEKKKAKPNLLEDVELPENPQIMEDEVLDGYNEATGEFDKLPEVYLVSKPSERDIFDGLSDDDLIEELLRRHPKAEGIYIKWR